MLLLINPIFADERRQLDHSLKNMDVMKKQASLWQCVVSLR
jgi:hypothetical protein